MATPKRNRSGRFVKGGRKSATRRPRRRATRQVAVFQANPAPKRRRRAKAAAPARRRYRRNPSGRSVMGGLKGFGQLIVPAAGVGGGAVLSELFMGYLPIPVGWKTGVMRQVTKGAVGVAAGWALAHFLKQKKLGFYVAAGAVVIAVHDGIKEFLTARAPDFGAKGAFGQYVAPPRHQFAGGGMGYINPARTARLGQYVRAPRSQFRGMGGDAIVYAHPGGETNFNA